MNKLLPILLVVVLSGCSSHKLAEPNRYENVLLDECINLDCDIAKKLCINISEDECKSIIRRHNMNSMNDVESRKPKRYYGTSAPTLSPSNKNHPSYQAPKKSSSVSNEPKKTIVIKRERTIEDKVRDLEFEIEMMKIDKIRNE